MLVLIFDTFNFVRPIDSNSFQFFVPGLPAATTLRLKIFAQNSKGRSDYSWLKAATLRPAERLIDSQSTSSGSSGSSGSSIFEESSNMLKGKPVLVLLSAAAVLLILIVIVVGIIAFVKMNRTHGGSSSSTFSESNSSHLHSSGGSHLQSNGQENDHLPSGDHHNNHFGSGSSNGPQSTFYKDELNDTNYCCEDDCCDQMLLTGTGSNDLRSYQPSSDYHQPSSSTKGPPDIIPSFGGYLLHPNCTATSVCAGPVDQFGVMDHHLHEKIPQNHFITYGMEETTSVLLSLTFSLSLSLFLSLSFSLSYLLTCLSFSVFSCLPTSHISICFFFLPYRTSDSIYRKPYRGCC